MATTAFGTQALSHSEDRQYPVFVFYHTGVNPSDGTAGAQFKLPPGAHIVGGRVDVLATGGNSIVVTDNQGTPVSLFGTVVTTATGQTVIQAFPYYPSGAVLTLSPTAANSVVLIEYVIEGRANEVAVL